MTTDSCALEHRQPHCKAPVEGAATQESLGSNQIKKSAPVR